MCTPNAQILVSPKKKTKAPEENADSRARAGKIQMEKNAKSQNMSLKIFINFKGKDSNSSVEKLFRYYLKQMIKVKITSYKNILTSWSP